MTTTKKAASLVAFLIVAWVFIAPVFWSIFDHLTNPIVEALSK